MGVRGYITVRQSWGRTHPTRENFIGPVWAGSASTRRCKPLAALLLGETISAVEFGRHDPGR